MKWKRHSDVFWMFRPCRMTLWKLDGENKTRQLFNLRIKQLGYMSKKGRIETFLKCSSHRLLVFWVFRDGAYNAPQISKTLLKLYCFLKCFCTLIGFTFLFFRIRPALSYSSHSAEPSHSSSHDSPPETSRSSGPSGGGGPSARDNKPQVKSQYRVCVCV